VALCRRGHVDFWPFCDACLKAGKTDIFSHFAIHFWPEVRKMRRLLGPAPGVGVSAC
jgi:hypothetical protein